MVRSSQIRKLVFGRGGPNGEVWTTRTVIDGFRFDHILAATLDAPYILQVEDIGYKAEVDVSSLIQSMV